MTTLALDTSVAIPLLVATHDEHHSVSRWREGRDAALPAHALAETYSVLTRLPGDLRTSPQQAAFVIDEQFGPPLLPDPGRTARLHTILSELQITGGAVYDALVALTAADHDAELATRDERAHRTYERVGARGSRYMSGPGARPGVAYLVGAGPGDRGLMTARSLELIATADAVLYDRLIPEEALAGARSDAELIYVGKAPGAVAMEQSETERVMVEIALTGRSVVRLKGGDPFVFGRGGEEAETLRDAGVPFEIVPG